MPAETDDTNYALIAHPQETCILLIEGEDGWTLPQHSANKAQEIIRTIKERFDLSVTVLYCAYDPYANEIDDDHEETRRVYALENQSSATTTLTRGRWLSTAELATVKLAIPEHKAVIATYLEEMKSGVVPEHRLSWARSGWFAQASSWIQEQLTNQNIHLTGPIEQISTSIWSGILYAPADAGNYYFKASSPTVAFEPRLTQTLSNLWSDHIPTIIAIEDQQHWMLMKDEGKTFRSISHGTFKIEPWREMLQQYARIQIEAVEHVAQLEAAGCPDRRLQSLPTLFTEALSDRSLLLIDEAGGLPSQELAQLHAFLPELQTLCTELAGYHIPETLHHDDFHNGNVLVRGDRYIFFDWAECAIAHPFYSMLIVQRYAKYVFKCDEQELDQLRDAYLANWTRYGTLERLQEAFTLAQRLARLCRALTWYRFSLQGAETRADRASFPYWLRVFLGSEE